MTAPKSSVNGKGGTRYILTEKDFLLQHTHKYFHMSKNTTPAYFVITTGAKRFLLYVCAGSHLYVFHLEKDREMLSNAVRLERSVFIQNLYFQVMETAKTFLLDGEGHMNCGITSSSSWGHGLKQYTRICQQKSLLLTFSS